MDFEKFAIFSFILVLILGTATIALADESFLVQSLSASELKDEISTFAPRGHIEDVSWVKKVSIEGVIEIDGIIFSVVNDDANSHLFEICAVIEGPFGKFTPSLDDPLSCTSLEMIDGNEKLINQSIHFPKGVKVSELIDISIVVQEI